MWATGSNTPQHKHGYRGKWQGFTLLELMAALAIAAIVLAVAVPASARMYDSIRYREAVREVVTLLATARHRAITSGKPQNFEVVPRERQVRLGEITRQLPGNVTLSVNSSKALNRESVGVIRFYPEGGTSGGDIDIASDRGRGVSIRVDWLMGGVTQASHAAR